MAQNVQIKDDLALLEIDENQELTIRYVTVKYKRLAKVVHPDRVRGDKCKFQEIQNAYKRIINYIEENQKMEDDIGEDDYEKDFFVKHNIMKECMTSFVVYIEELLVDKWKKVLESHLGITKMDKCRVIFKSVDITITLYEKPKKDNRSKLHIQSGNQEKNLEFIVETLSTFYREVCKLNEVIMTSFEFKNGQKSICEKCGKYFTNKKGVKQHMLRMHSSRRIVHKISRISVTDEESIEESSQQQSEPDINTGVGSLEFECGDCGYKSKDKETLEMHVEAVHLLPSLLNRQNKDNHSNITEELVEVDQMSINENDDSVVIGQVEERSCPTPIPEEIYICAKCSQGFESQEEFQEHEKSVHEGSESEDNVQRLNNELEHERSQFLNAQKEIERLKLCVNKLEETKSNLEEQIVHLLNEKDSNISEENKELRKKIEEQDKLMKKNEEKHTLEINELKRQQMLSSESLRSAIQERDTLRENDRILLNTFDIMKKHMDQIKEQNNKQKITETAGTKSNCDKCDYQTNSYKLLSDHQAVHIEDDDEMIEEIVYCCGRCDFKTKSNATLSEHIKEEHGKFPCQVCSKIFYTHFDMREHKESEHARISCKICNFAANNEEEINQHMAALHNKMHKCDRCEFEGTSNRSLSEHFDEKHIKENVFACDECKYESIIENNLLEHQQYKHGWSKPRSRKQNNYKSNSNKNRKLCVFWNHGFCRNENYCNFVHEEIPACHFQENCKKNNCSFYHFNKAQNTFLGRSLEKVSEKKH